jgi:hypothetical protein
MTNTELESPLAQTIERRIVFSDPKRIMIRQQDHRGSDTDSGSLLRDRGADHGGG